jgi:hypothetical protein
MDNYLHLSFHIHPLKTMLFGDSIMKKPKLQHRAFAALASVRADIERKYGPVKEQAPRIVHLTLNEAEAMAWESGFPHLVFPLLAEEKLSKAAAWVNRQRTVREDTHVLALAA